MFYGCTVHCSEANLFSCVGLVPEYVVMKSPDACVLCLPLARWTEFIGLL